MAAVVLRELGLVDYEPTLRAMREFTDGRDADTPDELWLLQHPRVFTQGQAGKAEHILAAGDIPVIQVDRGGQVTYHGPGQLVGYPVVDLAPGRKDIRRYVADLQRVLVDLLAELGIDGEGGGEQSRIGVWVGERKIASIGVHISRWITTHGFALNVETDLSYFRGIVPCGLQGVRMTSIRDLAGEAPPLESVAARCAHHFGRVFDRPMAGAEA